MTGNRDVVIVGVGQLAGNRERTVEAAREPAELIVDAVGRALADAGLDGSVLADLDLLDVVQIVSWRYDDPADYLARRLGAVKAATATSGVGGHQPVARLLALAQRLSAGPGRAALLVGGEAQYSLELLAKQRAENPWSHTPGGPAEFPREVGGTERMWDLGLVAPIRVYPLFENRLRSELQQSFAEAQAWSARMYAEFSEVAAQNEAAWRPRTYAPEDIGTVTRDNRMICHPYPIRMNANNRVDQASAVLMVTADLADELGVPESARVSVRAGATAGDCEDVLERPSYGASAGLEYTLDRTLEHGQTEAREVGVLDLYSCFPVVPKLAALHLGAERRPLSVTGGLSSFGGAHNNYCSHALVAAVRRLRVRGGSGLVYGNGEYLTKHAAVLLDARQTGRAPVVADPPPEAPGPAAPRFLDEYVGPAEVETYTVEYDRDGAPARAWVIGRNRDGDRVAARVSKSDTETIEVLVNPLGDPAGRGGRIERSGERRYFVIREGE